MSDTPRTDALEIDSTRDGIILEVQDVIDHARQLERELAAAQERETKLREAVELVQRGLNRWLPKVRPSDAPMDDQCGDDTMLLFGMVGGDDDPKYGEQLYERAEKAEAERDALKADAERAKKAEAELHREVLTRLDAIDAVIDAAREKP